MNTQHKSLKRLMSLIIVVCLTAMMSVAAFAADSSANTAVRDDTNGTLQVKLGVTDLENNKLIHYVQTGTGFLINDSTMVTCQHVVEFSKEAVDYLKNELGYTDKQINERKVIRISIYRDQTIEATIKTNSTEVDIAVLELKQQIQNRTYLKLRTSEVAATETVYALGFPGIVGYVDDANTFTSEDVTITSGLVNKVTQVNSVNYIVHRAQTLEGNSGGPLADVNGNVVGVTQAYTSANGFSSDYMYAITIDQVISMLDPLGIEYTTDSAPVPVPEPEPEPVPGPEPVQTTVDKSALNNAIQSAKQKDVSGYTDDSVAAFKTALSAAENVASKDTATQEEVSNAATSLAQASDKLVEKPGLPLPLILAVAGAVIAIIIVIVLLSGRNKKPTPRPVPGPGPGPMPGPVPPVNPVPSYTPPVAGTSVLNSGASETTVLNTGAGETTVLNGSSNFGTLTNKKTGEKISISKSSFLIGKERNSVDYCISGNTSVSRRHATIVNRGGTAYVVDNGSTNGTFVNGVKASANQEVKLNSGDTVTVSDVDFTYNEF